MKRLILSLALSAFALSLVAADADAPKDKATCPYANKDKSCCPAGKDAQAGGCCKGKQAADTAKADAAKKAEDAKK